MLHQEEVVERGCHSCQNKVKTHIGVGGGGGVGGAVMGVAVKSYMEERFQRASIIDWTLQ